jgi:hypothetical protein
VPALLGAVGIPVEDALRYMRYLEAGVGWGRLRGWASGLGIEGMIGEGRDSRMIFKG